MTQQNQQALQLLAETLFAMQEVLKFDAQTSGTPPNAPRVFGPIVAAHFSETRKALGLANSWATKEQHVKAVMDAAGSGLPAGPSPIAEFDLAGAGMCPTCALGGYVPGNPCEYCGS